jgi:hypothetical protein
MRCMLVAEGAIFGQKVPSVPGRPWDATLTTPAVKALPRVLQPPLLIQPRLIPYPSW